MKVVATRPKPIAHAEDLDRYEKAKATGVPVSRIPAQIADGDGLTHEDLARAKHRILRD